MARIWLSVDVEPDIADYMHASFRGISDGLPAMLALLNRLEVPSDFFVLGEVAEKHPDLVRDIASQGRTIGSHGHKHELLCTKSPHEQEKIIRKSLTAIEDATRLRVVHFRAPNFSANSTTILPLERAGIRYDSSVLPGRVKRRWRVRTVYDHRGAPRTPYRLSRRDGSGTDGTTVWELPVTENPLQRGTPLGLGFLNSYSVEKTAAAVEQSEGPYTSFLVHPWELVDLPVRQRGLPRWLETACRSDLSRLEAFLRLAKRRWGFTSTSEITQQLEEQ